VAFVKVAEFQRRGVVHFHALIRLDGQGVPATTDQHRRHQARRRHPPGRSARAAHRQDAHAPDLVLRFGDQLDIQTVNGGPTGELIFHHSTRPDLDELELSRALKLAAAALGGGDE
jgi:hypothetical protein